MDDLVVVGGLVPSLLIDQEDLPEGADAHVGTMDLDVGLEIALLNEGRYKALSERLRGAGFNQDVNESGNPTRQRWQFGNDGKITVDFLIEPSRPGDRGGRLRDIEPDFAAIIAPGLHLAMEDRDRLSLSGKTIAGEDATREIWVCGPGAYVILKAPVFRFRGENKDAYDLYYLVRNYGDGIEDVAAGLQPLLDDEKTKEALQILEQDFLRHDGLGPRRVAAFLTGGADDEIQADVVSFTEQLLDRCNAS